jgi:hypothetical protein
LKNHEIFFVFFGGNFFHHFVKNNSGTVTNSLFFESKKIAKKLYAHFTLGKFGQLEETYEFFSCLGTNRIPEKWFLGCLKKFGSLGNFFFCPMISGRLYRLIFLLKNWGT